MIVKKYILNDWWIYNKKSAIRLPRKRKKEYKTILRKAGYKLLKAAPPAWITEFDLTPTL